MNTTASDQAAWYKYLSAQYPNKILLDGKFSSFPSTLTLSVIAPSALVRSYHRLGPR